MRAHWFITNNQSRPQQTHNNRRLSERLKQTSLTPAYIQHWT